MVKESRIEVRNITKPLEWLLSGLQIDQKKAHLKTLIQMELLTENGAKH